MLDYIQVEDVLPFLTFFALLRKDASTKIKNQAGMLPLQGSASADTVVSCRCSHLSDAVPLQISWETTKSTGRWHFLEKI